MNESVAETIDSPAPQQAREVVGPSGVGGWLMVLCVWLTVVVPLTNLAVLGYSLLQTVPAYGRVPGLLLLDALNGAMVLALIAFSIFTGILLWQSRDARALQVLRILLFGFVLSKPVAAVLPFLVGMEPSVAGRVARSVLAGAGSAVIVPMIVLLYTIKSKRVSNTYTSVGPQSA